MVAREFNLGRDDALYASTPPLEALRLIISHAATIEPGKERREVRVHDVRRAYFYAKQQREVYIELPEEDEDAEPGQVGKLMLCLYGTRDAAKEWQKTLSRHLVSIGFVAGRGHPSIFAHPTRDIKMLVHGDDYFPSGAGKDLDWLESELGKAYEIQTQRLGIGPGRETEVKILNRIVRWTASGLEMEADPRHSELVVKQLGLEGCRPLSSPGIEGKDEEDLETDEPLSDELATKYRGVVARINYLAADRPDIQYATKEACRDMSRPSSGSYRRLERIGKYLVGKPRLIWHFELQGPISYVDAFADANWAGCRQSRKSTSGGTLIIGSHLIKTWSKTQATIAKSSAESELYGIVRATVESMGLLTLIGDLGGSIKARLHMDSTAAKGIIDREGLSKVRHLDVNVLWLQEQMARDSVPILKVLGTENNADLTTKHLSHDMIGKHIKRMAMEFRGGRSEKASNLQSVSAKNRAERITRAVNCIENLRDKYAEKNVGDDWISRGAGGKWIRAHRTARKSLFTPCRVPRGPAHPDMFSVVRRTIGVNNKGNKFEIVDNWKDSHCSHRLMEDPWTGTTEFITKGAAKMLGYREDELEDTA